MSNVVNLFTRHSVSFDDESEFFTYFADNERVYRETPMGVAEYFDATRRCWFAHHPLDEGDMQVQAFATLAEAHAHVSGRPVIHFDDVVEKNRAVGERLRDERARANIGVLKSYRIK